MKRFLLVSTRPEDRRVALLEDGRLYEFYWADKSKKEITGNIYLGRVQRVMTGLDAAFVDIGLARPGYLEMDTRNGRRQVLAEGDSVVVQVTREQGPNKGARLSSKVTQAGQYVVLEPGGSGIGVSRRIRSGQERQRLHEVLEELAPEDAGVVARTAAQGRSRKEIAQDIDFLQSLWARIQEKAAHSQAPALLFQANDILLDAAQDLVRRQCSRMVLDNEEDYDRVLRFVDSIAPEFDQAVELYEGPEPLFVRWKLVDEVVGIPRRVVPFGRGGTLIFDHTEALTAIDVNTGSIMDAGEREIAIFGMNLAAVHEIARQIRLRNIGGLIVIDLIGMQNPDHEARVYEALCTEMQKDVAYSTILPVSKLGVIEVARQKVREDTVSGLTVPCASCQGTGRTSSPRTVASQILDTAMAKVAVQGPGRLLLRASPGVIETLGTCFHRSLAMLGERAGVPVQLQAAGDFDANRFEVEHAPESKRRPRP